MDGVHDIPIANLALAFLPPLLMVGVLYAWSMRPGQALYALTRMLGQLLVIGYLLTFLFASDSALTVMTILAVMVTASSWIALSTVTTLRRALLGRSALAIGIAGGGTLALIALGVLRLDPWYEPRMLVPLAGMVFANAMNNVSVTAERLSAELARGRCFEEARVDALQAGLIPAINALFAVGLVSLPGMMTGQILSGVSPLVAVRYQIMVMCMIFGAGGLAAVLFLLASRSIFERRTAP